MFGNCAIGSVGIETSPSSKITSEHTEAKIGRRRKKSITKLGPNPVLRGCFGVGERPVGRGDLAHDAARDVADRHDSMLPQRGSGPSARARAARRAPASVAGAAARREPSTTLSARPGPPSRARRSGSPPRRPWRRPSAGRPHQVGVEAARAGDEPRLVRHRGRDARERAASSSSTPRSVANRANETAALAQRRREDGDAAAVDGELSPAKTSSKTRSHNAMISRSAGCAGFEIARERRPTSFASAKIPACLPLQLLCSALGLLPRAASAAAAGSYDGVCAPQARSSAVARCVRASTRRPRRDPARRCAKRTSPPARAHRTRSVP